VRGGLYDRVFSQYGPFYYAVFGLPSRLLDARWTIGAGRVTTLALWVATAAVSIVLVTVEMVARSRRIHSGLADEMIHAATEQFIQAGIAGALITFVLYRFAPETLWMLPGLWQIVFSLGVLASCRSLPRAMFAVGIWYLAAGLAMLAFANGTRAFAPWAMALPFGVGQLLMAAVLYRSVGATQGASHVEEA